MQSDDGCRDLASGGLNIFRQLNFLFERRIFGDLDQKIDRVGAETDNVEFGIVFDIERKFHRAKNLLPRPLSKSGTFERKVLQPCLLKVRFVSISLICRVGCF